MRWILTGATTIGALAAFASPAAAIESVHVGVLAHNIQVIDPKNAEKEDGPAVEVQVNFASPDFLGWAGSPQPYLLVSANVAGDTSFAGVGLEWRLRLGEHWAFTPGLGYVIHDGELENPYPIGSPENVAFARDHVLLGSRDLFRTSIGFERDFGERWSGQILFVHASHGQILGQGRNQGMDQLGLRLGYTFGG